MKRFLTVSPSCPAVPFMGGVTSTSTLELFGRFLSVGGGTGSKSGTCGDSPVLMEMVIG